VDYGTLCLYLYVHVELLTLFLGQQVELALSCVVSTLLVGLEELHPEPEVTSEN